MPASLPVRVGVDAGVGLPTAGSQRRRLLIAAAGLLAGCAGPGQVGLLQHASFSPPLPSEPAPLIQGPQAVAAALARGGYLIYLRHGRTQYDQIALERQHRDQGTLDLARCATQRQLSDEGRAELRVAGEQFRRAEIPLDRAFTSRYCRAIESAAFFVDGAEPTDSLSGEAEVGRNPAQKARTVAFLSQRPAPGRNHVMVAHGGIFWEATGFQVQEAHAVVLDPARLGAVVARISPADWGSIALMRPQ